ncbi:HAD family hydrolase [Candidatus Bathyarchaeota archaeon]|nr:HAD family hydrolase [Candidatus Bathyarchaeota archaeon]
MVQLIAGNKSRDCELVIFDKDGTLVDLTQVLFGLARARRLAVEERGGKEVANLWEKVMGVDLACDKMDYGGPLTTAPRQQEVLIAAACFYLTGYSWEEARKHAEKAYDEADEFMKPPFGTVLIPGVGAMLKQMKAHGLKLAIASTDTHRRITSSFEALGIAMLFDAFVGDDDVVNGKPAPDMIVEAMKRTGCTPEQTIMVGDSVSDMHMGRNAKVQASIGVLTGSTKKEKLEQSADAVVSSAAELRAL